MKNIIRLQDVAFDADEVVGTQYLPAEKNGEGVLIRPACFDVVFKSGPVLNIVAGRTIYNRVNAQIFGADEPAGDN